MTRALDLVLVLLLAVLAALLVALPRTGDFHVPRVHFPTVEQVSR